MKNNPYVGPRPYERGDRRNFYGRKREARDLSSLIMAERVVLFYAPSGAGKTSLLNAQVIPTLEENDFHVLPTVRVGSDLPPGIDPQDVENIFVFSALMGLAGEETPAQTLTEHTLFSFLSQFYPEKAIDPDQRPPILILDQFEEILTTHRDRWQEARGFFQQVREALRKMPTLGVVLTMREDYVAGLDPYAILLPRRLNARFRMERLDRKGALEAMKQPALNAGCSFDPGVAERLVDDLRRIKTHRYGGEQDDDVVFGPFVEPVQLQVVCNRLWDNLPEQKDLAIQWEEVEKFGDVNRALTDFYENALARSVQQTARLNAPQPGVSERQLRHWFGEQLITPMQTRGLALRGEHETGGLPNEAVDILEEQHLIRADMRAGTRWYELAHDRLVDPILQSNRAWEAARLTPLRLAARRWKDAGEDAGILYRGQTLEEALSWAEAHASEVEPYEREFLEASQQNERFRTRMHRLRIAGTVLAVLTIVSVSVLALIANQAKNIARSKQLASMSLAWRMVNQEQSILLARLAVDEVQTTEAKIALRQAVSDFYPSEILEGPAAAYSVAYSPKGRFLATGMAAGTIRVWDAEVHRTVWTVQSPHSIWSVAYSPDGRFLATGSSNAIVHLRDASTGSVVTTLAGPSAVYSLDYSPDGRFIASGSGDGVVRLWDTSTGALALHLTGHTALVRSLAFSPGGHLLASGSWDDTVRLWEISTAPDGDPEASAAMTLTHHTADVNSVAFSPDGNLLASGSDDRTIQVWDVATGEAILTLVGHADSILSLAFSADGRFLISGSRDATVRLWDVLLRKQDAVATLTGHTSIVNSVAYNPSGRFLASGSGDLTVRVWDTEPPAGAMFTTLTGHTGWVRNLDYSPDGKFLASVASDGTARIWSLATGETVTVLPRVSGSLWDATYSPDGRHLVTCSSDDAARIWDIETASVVATLAEHEADVEGAAYSPDGRYLATASDDKTARLWDVATGETVRVFEGHTGMVYAIAYSPDGRTIATGSTDDDVRIWDVETGETIATLSGHTHDIFRVVYSPDGKHLASGSWDRTARIWNLETYTTEAILAGHTAYVYSVDYSPDGNYAATSSWDRTVRVWDLSQSPPETIAILIGHTGLVRSVMYSPDGKTIASGSMDGTIRRYPARFEDVLTLSRQYVPRELTVEERASLLGEKQ